MAVPERFRIELDTGGTFTDGYVSSAQRSIRSKVDTTPHDISEGILGCIDHAAALLGLDRPRLLRQTDAVRLSTTIGTNTLINRDGAKVGLLMDAATRAAVADRLPATLPLERELIAQIPAADAPDVARGTVAAVRRLLEQGARIVVVALVDGIDLAEREQSVRGFVASEYPRHYLGAVPIVPSHEVTLASDPLVRVCTAVLDAYLHPAMGRFLYRVEDELRRSGYAFPLLVAQSNGGASRVAKTTAIRTWGSGPAGGVAAAAALAGALQLDSVLAIDVGGTSSDLTLISEGRWRYAVQPRIGDVSVSLPVLKLHSVGIGGGSIASVSGKTISVGPRSAGAQPGPAAFGLGGAEATVTDAACLLGVFDPTHFLGGRKALDCDASRRVIEEKIARPLQIDAGEAAQRILKQGAEVVAREATTLLKERGVKPSETWLFASGGGGGLIAAEVASRARLAGFFAFPLSPVFSAFGLSRLALLHVYEARFDDQVLATLTALSERAVRDMRGEGVDPDSIHFALEGEIVSAEDQVDAIDFGPASDLAAAIARASQHRSGLRVLRLKASVPARHSPLATCSANGAAQPSGMRAVIWNGESQPTPLFEWDALPAGSQLQGPAVIESRDTTVPIPPGTRIEVGSLGELRVTRSER